MMLDSMTLAAKKENHRKCKEDDDINVQMKKQKLKPSYKSGSSLSTKLTRSSNKDIGKERLKKKIVKKAIVHKAKTSKKQLSLSVLKDKNAKKVSTKEREKPDERDVKSQNLKRRRRRKKGKNNTELDEASKLQRKTRYLLIKVKVEQNLIDAYSTEGWKGQSREKIRPEKELQRAKKQILDCKLGIRETIRQLDLLSSVGCINDSVVAPDGSVHHEHIICAKCKLREAFPNNDIILCDGTCNCAFHQKCLDPPLLTENIPPEGEGWFCKFCKTKMEILEATNAHLGTHFPVNSNWQDIFKEEAALPNNRTSELCPEEEWPSDDSEDSDYDPVGRRCSEDASRSDSYGSDCSSSSQVSLEDETFHAPGSFDNSIELIGADSDEFNDGEVLCRPRQRGTVDYIKLYDEMFGNTATEIEQISDDEDWGPTKKKSKIMETAAAAASTLMILGETEKNVSNEMPTKVKEKLSRENMKRSIFRLPPNATEKLKLTFAENELPERAVRENLSKQLGLEFEKVNKWFKNARYLALKARKAGREYFSFRKEPISEMVKDENDDETKVDNVTLSPSKTLKKFVRRRNTHLQKIRRRRKQCSTVLDNDKTSADIGDDVSLKQMREKAKEAKKKSNSKRKGYMLEAEAEMERLCTMQSRVEKLKQVLLELPSSRFSRTKEIKSKDSSVIYVPVAELKEKS